MTTDEAIGKAYRDALRAISFVEDALLDSPVHEKSWNLAKARDGFVSVVNSIQAAEMLLSAEAPVEEPET